MLQKLQNRAARIVTNGSYDSSASALIKTLNWPMVADMIKVETASFHSFHFHFYLFIQGNTFSD